MRLIYVASALCCCSRAAQAQGQQLWLDYQVDYPFANVYLFEVSGSYQTLMGSSNKWRNFSVTPTFEWQWLTYLDVIVNVPTAYTVQTNDFNSFESGLSLGARYHVSQNRRVTSNLIFKIEQRYMYNFDIDDWDTSNRARLKGEILVAVNKANLFQDQVFWTITDFEEFIVTNQQLDERYANRRRARLGVGYRHNYKHRFELIYTWQSSRDEIDGDFIQRDNVLQLRYKMFLNPSKPKTETTDN